ncbi:MAG: rhodanese-like domain-containing protein [Prochloraceae cyanobacterium]|nr:rhodanese-like domain-containing protein [Prochloraceae cyanobacterium]
MSQYAFPEVLIDIQWLAEHLQDPDLRIIEADMSPEAYQNAHIPGAIFWLITKDLMLPDLTLNLDKIAFEQLMSKSGITKETTVVAYGSYPGMGGLIFWFLKLFGHDKVKVLNGGYQKWKAEGYPLAEELSTFAPTEYRAKLPDRSLRAFSEEVQASIGKSDRVLLDVRTSQEYSGEWFFSEPPKENQRTGHIPGALHIEHLVKYPRLAANALVGASCFPPIPPIIQDYFWSYSASSGFARISDTNTCKDLVFTQADSLLPKEYILLITRLFLLPLQGYGTHLASLDYPAKRIVVYRVYRLESSLTTATSLHFSLYLSCLLYNTFLLISRIARSHPLAAFLARGLPASTLM